MPTLATSKRPAKSSNGLSMARQVRSPYWVRSAAGWLASALIGAAILALPKAVLGEELSEETPMDTIAGRLFWCAEADSRWLRATRCALE